MNERGFTMVEIIIYIAIVAMVSTSFISFYLSTSNIGTKSFTLSESRSNERVLEELIRYHVRNATSITSPTKQSTTTSIVLMLKGNSTTTSIFNLGGIVYAKTGATSTAMTTDESYISNLAFFNYGNASTTDMINVTGHINNFSTSSAEYYYDDDFDFNIARPY